MKDFLHKRISLYALAISCLMYTLIFHLITNAQQVDKNNGVKDSRLVITYPFDKTLFPPEIATPTFKWEENKEGVDSWKVIIEINNNKEVFSKTIRETQWKPERQLWEMIKSNSFDSDAIFKVRGLKGDKIFAFDSISFRTSKDSVAAPIFFRDVPLPFGYALDNLDKIRWRSGDISSDSMAPVVLENLPVCANCHSFSANGKVFAMDVDAHSDKDAYAIANVEMEMNLDKLIRWSAFQKYEPTYALLSNISPTGQYIASTLLDNEYFVKKPDLAYSQLFFPIKGILVIYENDTRRLNSLPGADDTMYVQSNPNWSPDGRYIYFTRAKAIHGDESGLINAFSKDSTIHSKFAVDFLEGKRGFKYDIFRIPFNKGKGGIAVPLQGASRNGKSNYFPRVSPDNKWLVFTQAENFMLLQPDSKLMIMPAEGGKPRQLSSNSTNLNSWHSWSPNGKWLVFSSKMHTLYTRLYLTHIDEDGNDSPPVMLENFLPADRAANIPEFINIEPGGLQKIIPKFLENDHYLFLHGINSAETGDLEKAIEYFTKGIEADPDYQIQYSSRGSVYIDMKKYDSAMADFNTAIKLKPNDSKSYNLRALCNLEMKNYLKAIKDYSMAIELLPHDYESYNGRGYILCGMEKYQEAIADFSKAIDINPDFADAFYLRGLTKSYLNDFAGAVKDFDQAIIINPGFKIVYYQRANAKLELGKKDEACKDLKRAYQLGLKTVKKYIDTFCK
ncbi:tetratricopeptide repeat protein [Bacteroidota bacterium]